VTITPGHWFDRNGRRGRFGVVASGLAAGPTVELATDDAAEAQTYAHCIGQATVYDATLPESLIEVTEFDDNGRGYRIDPFSEGGLYTSNPALIADPPIAGEWW
jgi:hypothetical protein